jgi:hypothetical protein
MVSNSDEIVFEVVKGTQLDLLSKKSREKYEIEYDLIKKIMTEKNAKKVRNMYVIIFQGSI